MKLLNKYSVVGVGVAVLASCYFFMRDFASEVVQKCPTPETFSQDFNRFSIEFLEGHPEYGEKEQREGWDKHLEEMGCIEERDIIDNAICADCEDNAL